MQRPVIVLAVVALLALTGCGDPMSTSVSCEKYRDLQDLYAANEDLTLKYVDQLKALIDQAPDTVKGEMQAIYLIESKSPDADNSPEHARRLKAICDEHKYAG